MQRRQWNLSSDCLTSVAAHSRLRNLKETDLGFQKELKISKNWVLSESDPQPEDIVDAEENLVEDNSDVLLGVLIQELIEKKSMQRLCNQKHGCSCCRE